MWTGIVTGALRHTALCRVVLRCAVLQRFIWARLRVCACAAPGEMHLRGDGVRLDGWLGSCRITVRANNAHSTPPCCAAARRLPHVHLAPAL